MLNGVVLALGVWAAPCSNDKVSCGNEGLCLQGDTRKRTDGQKTPCRAGVRVTYNLTPLGYKQGLH